MSVRLSAASYGMSPSTPPKTGSPSKVSKAGNLNSIASAVANIQINGKSLKGQAEPGILLSAKSSSEMRLVLLFAEHQKPWAKSFAEHLCSQEGCSEESEDKFATYREEITELNSGSFDVQVELSSNPADWVVFLDKHLKFKPDQVTQLVLEILQKLPNAKEKDAKKTGLMGSFSTQLQVAFTEYLNKVYSEKPTSRTSSPDKGTERKSPGC
jgi:hypothetical protein